MADELIDLVLEEADGKMANAVVHTRGEFSSVRTGRASPALVEKLPVDAYGEQMMMQQLAGFAVPEARQLLITPFDKANVGAIEKAIQNSDLGLNPSNDGISLRLSFPPLTQERRRDLVRVVKQMAEDGRIAIRQVRREARKDLETLQKDGDISEDDLLRAEKGLDAKTHAEEARIDASLSEKEDELLEV